MNDLGTLALHDPPHDVDRRIMPIEQTGGGHDPDLVGR
jgi:hypothetical protein